MKINWKKGRKRSNKKRKKIKVQGMKLTNINWKEEDKIEKMKHKIILDKSQKGKNKEQKR